MTVLPEEAERCWACGREMLDLEQIRGLALCGACERLYYRLKKVPGRLSAVARRADRTKRVVALVRSLVGQEGDA